MGLGEKIKQARSEAGLTLDDLAFRIREYETLDRASGSQLSRWEKNDVERLSFYAIRAIALETGKPLEFFSEPRDASDAPPEVDDPSSPRGVVGRAAEARERRSESSAGRLKRRSSDSKG